MDGVKWFKINNGYDDVQHAAAVDSKLKQIMKHQNGKEYICVWALLDILVEFSDSDEFTPEYFSKEIPYTDEVLAEKFNMPLPIVSQAMQLFENLGMISIITELSKTSVWKRYREG